jgi:hypothetical protein
MQAQNLTVSIGNMTKKKLHCQHRQYEEEKLHWLVYQSQDAVLEKEGILLDSERKIANELENDIHGIQDKAQFCKQNWCELSRKKELWEKLENIANNCSEILLQIERLQLPPMKSASEMLKQQECTPQIV